MYPPKHVWLAIIFSCIKPWIHGFWCVLLRKGVCFRKHWMTLTKTKMASSVWRSISVGDECKHTTGLTCLLALVHLPERSDGYWVVICDECSNSSADHHCHSSNPKSTPTGNQGEKSFQNMRSAPPPIAKSQNEWRVLKTEGVGDKNLDVVESVRIGQQRGSFIHSFVDIHITTDNKDVFWSNDFYQPNVEEDNRGFDLKIHSLLAVIKYYYNLFWGIQYIICACKPNPI